MAGPAPAVGAGIGAGNNQQNTNNRRGNEMRVESNQEKKCHVQVFHGGVNEMVGRLPGAFERMVTTNRAYHMSRGQWVEGSAPVLARGYMKNWDDVMEAVRTPWQHGIDTIRAMVDQLSRVSMPRPVSVRRVPRYNSEGGDEVDVDRLRAGQDYWRKCVRDEARGPRVVTVFADVTTSASVSADQILWRGAAAVALTHVLEKAGYRVELWTFQNCTNGYVSGWGEFAAARIKAAGQPLNLNAVACGVAGWFYRTAMFSAYYAEAGDTPTSDLGNVQNGLEEWQWKMVTPEAEPIILAGVWSFDSAVDRAKKWIERSVMGKKVPDLDHVYRHTNATFGGMFGGSFGGSFGRSSGGRRRRW